APDHEARRGLATHRPRNQPDRPGRVEFHVVLVFHHSLPRTPDGGRVPCGERRCGSARQCPRSERLPLWPCLARASEEGVGPPRPLLSGGAHGTRDEIKEGLAMRRGTRTLTRWWG